MEPERRDELLSQFLEGRLSSEGERELLALLRERPELARELRTQAAIHAILGARRDALFRTGRDGSGGRRGLGSERARPLPSPPGLHRTSQTGVPGRRRPRTWARALLVAAGLILALSAGWWLSRKEEKPRAPLATIDAVREEVTVSRNGKVLPASAGFALEPEDVLRTQGGGEASFLYGDDRTRVELSSASELRLVGDGPGKKVTLSSGTLRAEVAHQRPDSPMVLATRDAEAVILGTRFLLRVEPQATRLEVETGQVRLVRKADRKAVVVREGHFSVAGAAREMSVEPLPSPSRLYRVASSRSLWSEYAQAPDRHPNIPNCSFAGYRYGEAPIPEPPVAANVRLLGALGDGKTDDTPAFRAAIRQARESGGGAILVPEGRYRLTSLLHLDHSGLVLRGEGAQKSVLEFEKSLTDLLGAFPGNADDSRWSWSGGMIWAGPADTFLPEGGLSRRTEHWEDWTPGEPLGNVSGSAARGDTTVEIAPETGARLRAGETVLLTWSPGGDVGFFQHLAGHELVAKEYDWRSATELLATPQFRWPVEILRVSGSRVTLRQPLRLDVRPEWKVRFESLGSFVSDIGIERLTVRLRSHKQARHRLETGWNGIYFNRALHSWVREVTVENSELGLGVAHSKCIQVDRFQVTGQRNHHGITFRASSHDCLASDFEIRAVSLHGISAEWLSSGLVWRRGSMNHGTFDSQRGMPFDLLRTNITVTNDGSAGGLPAQGPRYGARVVHWNVRASGQSDWVNNPETISSGALVGILGVDLSLRVIDGMPPGYKDCVVGDPNAEPSPPDLYEAQLRLRLGKEKEKK